MHSSTVVLVSPPRGIQDNLPGVCCNPESLFEKAFIITWSSHDHHVHIYHWSYHCHPNFHHVMLSLSNCASIILLWHGIFIILNTIISRHIVSCFHNDIVFHTFHHHTTMSCLLSVFYNPESALRKAQVPVHPILNTHFDTCRISEMQMKCASFAELSFMTFGFALNRKQKETLIRCLRC